MIPFNKAGYWEIQTPDPPRSGWLRSFLPAHVFCGQSLVWMAQEMGSCPGMNLFLEGLALAWAATHLRKELALFRDSVPLTEDVAS